MEAKSKARPCRPVGDQAILKGLEKKLHAPSPPEVGKRVTRLVRRVLDSLILPEA